MFNFLKNRSKSTSNFAMASNESPSLVHSKQRLQRVFIIAMFVLLVASITDMPSFSKKSEAYDIDQEVAAKQDIITQFSFDTENMVATHEAKENAALRVPNTWRIDTQRVNDQLNNLERGITLLSERTSTIEEAVRQALLASTSDQTVETIVDLTVRKLVTDWKKDSLAKGFPEVDDLVVWLSPDLATLPTREYEPDDETNPKSKLSVLQLIEADDRTIEFSNLLPLTEMSTTSLEYILTAGVKQKDRPLIQNHELASTTLIIERSIKMRDLTPYQEIEAEQVPDAQVATELLQAHIVNLSKELPSKYEKTFTNWDKLAIAAYQMAKTSITDTLTLDDVRTAAAREAARQKEPAIMETIPAGVSIQDANKVWTEQSRLNVKTYWSKLDAASDQPGSLFGPTMANMVFVSLLLMALQRAVAVLEPKRIHAFKSMNVMLFIIAGTVMMGRVILVFDASGFLVPMTASAVLLTILTNARLASIASLLIAAMLSIQYGQDWRLFMIAAAMSITAIISIYRVRKRQDIATAVLKATMVGILLMLASTLSTGTLVGMDTLYAIGTIAFNGLVCTLIIPGLLPPMEKLFSITTDIQLLEYSDLNNEVLNRLAIKVPATYAHSLMMGQMAEAACDAIGANGLLARVSAYYHDIGKLRRPEYFSENQTGYNIHDDLSPRLSARAIASHVTEGVELAREHHLPQPIIRGILEHHGNSLISFFYAQALEQQKHGDVREEDFRYPGPKPQSMETGILMICDAVESGVRTIKNPNEERVREFIDKIIQARSNDRQFDECDLTLKQLDVIGDVLTKIVCSAHHSRVSYPEKPAQEEATNVIHISSGGRS